MGSLRVIRLHRPLRDLVLGTAATLLLLASGLVLPFLVWLAAIERSWLFGLAAVGAGALCTAAAVGVGRFAWPGASNERAFTAILAGFGAFVFVGVLALIGGVLVLAVAELCGDTSPVADLATNVVAALAYAAVGVWAFLRPGRVYLGWPLAAVAGVTAFVALVAITASERAACFN